MAAARLAALSVLGVALAAGCDDLGRFSTGPGESYCGAITLGGAFRTGLSPRVQMRLKLDAAVIDTGVSPGVISAYEAPDGDQPERWLLRGASLRPVPAMAHDPISRLEFGEGRERNLLYAVSPTDPDAESMLAVVSLKSNGTAEVRLMRAGVETAGDTTPPPGRRAIFGVFPLSREDGECGF